MTVERRGSLRDRQRDATRQLILDAAFRLLHEEPNTLCSHEAVAERAGVAVRTIYRHFPTRHDLTLALWQRLRDTHGTRWPHTEADIVPLVRYMYGRFEADAALTRAAIIASSSTSYPVHGSAEGRDAFRRSLAGLLASLTAAEGDRLLGICVAIYSAPFWQMLRDRGQLSAQDAADAGAATMQAVLAAAHAGAAGAPNPNEVTVMQADQSAETFTAYTLAAGQGRTAVPLNVVGEETLVKVAPADSGGQLAAFHLVAPPMSGPPRHVHSREDEWFYVLEGELVFEINGTQHTVGPGGSVWLRRGAVHAYQNFTAHDARLLIVTTPGEFCGFFVEMSAAAPLGGMPTREAFAALDAKYGITTVGPPMTE